MRVLWMLVGLYASIAFAQSDVAIQARELQAQIAAVQQEQQSVYQQFQMLQQFKRDEQQALNPPVVESSPVYGGDNGPPNYDDMVRERQARHDRIQRYTNDANELYARYQALEQQKQQLLAQLRALTQQQ
jgi:hypothetical protein